MVLIAVAAIVVGVVIVVIFVRSEFICVLFIVINGFSHIAVYCSLRL